MDDNTTIYTVVVLVLGLSIWNLLQSIIYYIEDDFKSNPIALILSIAGVLTIGSVIVMRLI